MFLHCNTTSSSIIFGRPCMRTPGWRETTRMERSFLSKETTPCTKGPDQPPQVWSPLHRRLQHHDCQSLVKSRFKHCKLHDLLGSMAPYKPLAHRVRLSHSNLWAALYFSLSSIENCLLSINATAENCGSPEKTWKVIITEHLVLIKSLMQE